MVSEAIVELESVNFAFQNEEVEETTTTTTTEAPDLGPLGNILRLLVQANTYT